MLVTLSLSLSLIARKCHDNSVHIPAMILSASIFLGGNGHHEKVTIEQQGQWRNPWPEQRKVPTRRSNLYKEKVRGAEIERWTWFHYGQTSDEKKPLGIFF